MWLCDRMLSIVKKNCVLTENKRVHQELRRAAAEVARLQKKARKGERTLMHRIGKGHNPFYTVDCFASRWCRWLVIDWLDMLMYSDETSGWMELTCDNQGAGIIQCHALHGGQKPPRNVCCVCIYQIAELCSIGLLFGGIVFRFLYWVYFVQCGCWWLHLMCFEKT